METQHSIYFKNSTEPPCNFECGTVDLVVTSPPYPMIEMWDRLFTENSSYIIEDNLENNPRYALHEMHLMLDRVWSNCFRLLKDGGFMCINIGDATRTLNGEFGLYDNHSHISTYCENIVGFKQLPCIIWHKPTNSPNKFMGSGMLPCGAYVTMEHEYILIFRKGGKREFKTEQEKQLRRESAFFWEERNIWFSDTWDIRGVRQAISGKTDKERTRNASYPLEIPYRLINMFSQKGDTVFDPFVGLGTTTKAAMITGRNSIGYDIDSTLKPFIESFIDMENLDSFNEVTRKRYQRHIDFVHERENKLKKQVKYFNDTLGCKVMTKQEQNIKLDYVKSVKPMFVGNLGWKVNYH